MKFFGPAGEELRVIHVERIHTDPSTFVERPIDRELVIEAADRSIDERFALWPRLRERMREGGTTTVVAPAAVEDEALTNLGWGLSMYLQDAQAWLAERWRGLLKDGVHGAIASESTFEDYLSPPAGFTVAMMVDATRGMVRIRRRQLVHVTCWVMPLNSLAQLEDEEFGPYWNIAQFMDDGGPTCLTRHQVPEDVLNRREGSISDFTAIVDGTIEAYIPVYFGESYAIWRPR